MKWDEITRLFQGSANEVTLKQHGAFTTEVLSKMGIPEASTMGQVMLNMSRLVVNGYLRAYGAEIPKISEQVKQIYPGNKIVIATDVWGGIFAIGNGDFAGDTSVIWYYAPDTLQWESTDINYPQFIAWIFTEKFAQFHASFLCEEMDSLLKTLADDQGVLVYPFLWSKECNIKTATKKAVPFEELLVVNAEYQRKLYGEPEKKKKFRFPFFGKK